MKTGALPQSRRLGAVLDVLRRMSKNKAAMIGFAIFVLEIIIAVFAPLLAPYDYQEMNFAAILADASREHIMGCDDLGRDIFSRIIYGTRYSLGLGITSVIVSTAFGIILGAVAGYFGGMVDNTVMRFLDIFQSIPPILLCVAVSTALGSGYLNTILALAIGNIPSAARMLRGSILNIRKMEYLEAADSVNSGTLRTIISHVLPNSFSPMIVFATMGVPKMIMAAASLSFIGLGVPKGTPEWGAILSDSRSFMQNHPHTVIYPGLAIAVTVLALNMMGDGLRDALDPKLKD